MELIHNNPYRIAGILSNSTSKELERQKSKFKAYTRVGKEIKSDFDFQILENINRSEEMINQAFSNVAQNQDKVNHAIFWFINISPFDNTAIEYLKKGNEEKAIEIWNRITNHNDVSLKNFSAYNNLGTLKLLSKDKSDVKKGIDLKFRLIESKFFENFVYSVADETFSIDIKKQIEKLLEGLLKEFQNNHSNFEILDLFSEYNGTNKNFISDKFTEEPLHNIESQIQSCKKKRKANKSRAYEFGLKLFTNTKDELSLLKSLLGKRDLKYKSVADQLANEILQCGIDFFNESQENDSSENYLESCQKLTKLADSVAIGKLTKDRAKDSLVTLADMKDREINQAIKVLQSIKDAYDNNARQLMAQVKEQEASMGYGDSINWTKVAELINDSINWDKATELIVNVIPRENINIIKNSQNTSKVREYRKLVEFVLDKIGYYQKSKIKYIQFWQTKRKTTTSTRIDTASYQSQENEFSFFENAWWILGIVGVLIGLVMGFGLGSIFTGFIGLGIGSKLSD